MADASVRPATTGDAPAIARLQGAVWSQVYADLLPAETFDDIASGDGVATWERAVGSPPSPRHRVLVALAGDELIGFAALAPASDPDLVAALDAELHSFCVAPDRTRRGHGSRLVNASVDVLRAAGFAHLHVWLTDREAQLRSFLEKAGWADDGARRSLDLRGDGEVLADQVRLRTSIADPA